MNTENSKSLFSKAQKYIPGGVNSPVRTFKAVGGNPLFIRSAKGATMTDVDGNEYIELINSWGPMILGHANEKVEEAVRSAISASLSFGAPCEAEAKIAEWITQMIPSVEKVRMVNSGTEATMSAIRVARGYTQREKIIKMEGCYHGHGDSFLLAAGSGPMTMGTANSSGVTKGTAKDTLTAPFNDVEVIKQLIENNKNQIAAIILEPVAGNMGCILPKEGYLQGLRDLCDANNIVLIFDEVMTGFRLAKGGAQEIFGVTPDMTTLGKVIGGGMPVGAYGGKTDIMDCVAPQGPVYQAGTLSGNPIAMASGMAVLRELRENPNIYLQLESITSYLVNGIRNNIKELGLNYSMSQIGSMSCLYFTDQEVFDFQTAKTGDEKMFAKYFRGMLKKGIYLAPSLYETLFISTAVTEEIANKIITANKEVLMDIHR